MGARTDAARAEVLASREALLEESVRLEAAARAAFDIRAKMRKEPIKTAGLAAGAGFLLFGGPKRTVRAMKGLFGRKEVEVPPSLLPDEIERVVRNLGVEGPKVRSTLEREFANYLESTKEARQSRGIGAVVGRLTTAAAAPLVAKAGKDLADRLFSPDANLFDDAMTQLRRREAARETGTADRPKTTTDRDEGR